MNERLRVLAEQAGFVTLHYSVGGIGWIWVSDGYPIDNQLERFAALVRDDALEEAIRLLEELRLEQTNQCLLKVSDCIDEIRLLKDKP